MASSRWRRSAWARSACAGVEEARAEQSEEDGEEGDVDREHANVEQLGGFGEQGVAEHDSGVEQDHGEESEQERVGAKTAGVLAPGDLDRAEGDRGDPGEQERAAGGWAVTQPRDRDDEGDRSGQDQELGQGKGVPWRPRTLTEGAVGGDVTTRLGARGSPWARRLPLRRLGWRRADGWGPARARLAGTTPWTPGVTRHTHSLS